MEFYNFYTHVFYKNPTTNLVLKLPSLEKKNKTMWSQKILNMTLCLIDLQSDSYVRTQTEMMW